MAIPPPIRQSFVFEHEVEEEGEVEDLRSCPKEEDGRECEVKEGGKEEELSDSFYLPKEPESW